MGIMYKSKETNLDICDQKGYGKFISNTQNLPDLEHCLLLQKKKNIRANRQSVGTGRWFYSIFDLFTYFGELHKYILIIFVSLSNF